VWLREDAHCILHNGGRFGRKEPHWVNRASLLDEIDLVWIEFLYNLTRRGGKSPARGSYVIGRRLDSGDRGEPGPEVVATFARQS